jgi:hypothetical protein
MRSMGIRLVQMANRQIRWLLLLTFFATFARSTTAQETPSSASRQFGIDPEQIEAKLIPDKTRVMLGEPVFLSFVVINHSKKDLQVTVGGDYRNWLGRPNSFSVTVADKDGHQLNGVNVEHTMGGVLFSKKLPSEESYEFRLFLPHWAKIETVGNYDITAERILKIGLYDPKRSDPGAPTLDISRKKTCSIQVVPLDDDKLFAIIERTGKDYLAGIGEARVALTSIDDARVIPFFLQSLESRSSDMKHTALDALSKFDSDLALSAIKRALQTSGNDIANTTTRELADTLAEEIRFTAAVALSRSPHPDAKQTLLSLRSDSNRSIRNTVVQYVSKLGEIEAVPILEQMVNDSEESIRDEASRYLKIFLTKNKH